MHNYAAQLIRTFFLLLLNIYKYTFAALLGGQCRFHPSCSEYAEICIKEIPLYKAFPLIIWRLLRCQPFAKGGEDYPPVKKDVRPGGVEPPTS